MGRGRNTLRQLQQHRRRALAMDPTGGVAGRLIPARHAAAPRTRPSSCLQRLRHGVRGGGTRDRIGQSVARAGRAQPGDEKLDQVPVDGSGPRDAVPRSLRRHLRDAKSDLDATSAEGRRSPGCQSRPPSEIGRARPARFCDVTQQGGDPARGERFQRGQTQIIRLRPGQCLG